MSGTLITGATTPVGAALVASLLDGPTSGSVVAVGAEASATELPAHPRLTYLQADLTDHREVRRLLFDVARRLDVDTIVHTALHRRATDSGHRVHALNVESTRHLLDLSEHQPNIHRFVYRSFSEIYRIEHDQPNLIDEEHPLELSPWMPQRMRDRLEADITVNSRVGLSRLHIVILRFAEVLAPRSGSQLWDYLSSRVCFRPLGFDPMINVLSVEDAVDALLLAIRTPARGAFNIPGADTLPLSDLIRLFQRVNFPTPEPLLSPLYRLRAAALGRDFLYTLNQRRFHFTGILDGTRARRSLGYRPQKPIQFEQFVIARGSRHPCQDVAGRNSPGPAYPP